MTFTPINDQVLTQTIPREATTAGGLHIPEAARDDSKFERRRVLAVGPGRPLKSGGRAPMGVSVGDVVVTNWRKGTRVKPEQVGAEGDGPVWVVREADILGVEVALALPPEMASAGNYRLPTVVSVSTAAPKQEGDAA